MTHLKRAGALLVVVLLFIFIGLRVIPVPAFLTDYGFHPRDAEKNTEQWASLPIQYVSSSTCVDCHQDKYSMWQQGNHRTVNCESCHGPARAHLETKARFVTDTSKELCGLCHARLVSRPSDFPQVDNKGHYLERKQNDVLHCFLNLKDIALNLTPAALLAPTRYSFLSGA